MTKKTHLILTFCIILLVGAFSLSFISASDFIFQNDTEDDLVIIHGDTGNLTVAGDISARDGFFRNLGSLVSRITSLFVQDVNVSGDINVTGDIRVGGDIDVTGNVSASWFKGIYDWIVGTASQVYLSFNGTQLDFDESQLNQTIDTRISGSESGLHVNISDYWNTGDRGALRNISQIQGSWLTNDLSWINFTDGDTRYILITDESDLNVNRSEWWKTAEGDLNDVSDILGSWLTNDLAWINFSEGDTQYLLITDETNLNVNASDYWITDEGVKKNVVDVLGSEITNDLGWINQTQGDALYVPIGRTLTAGAGLTGGGNLSEDRSFAVGQGTGIIVNSDDIAVNTTYLSDNYIDEAQSAGGDLGGTYPNPSVFKINGTSLGTTTATSGNILIGSGTAWETKAVSGDINISSAGLTTIQPDSVALGTDTTGNYVGDVAQGSGISVSGTPGEGYTETVSIAFGDDLLGWTNLTDYPDECPAGHAVKQIGDTLTCINISAQGSETLDGYDSTFFMPLNTSVVGNFSFNGGWTEGGLSIIGGDIYAQTGYFYNISSLEVTHLKINGSLIPDVTGSFDLGSSDKKWRDLWISRDASIGGDLSLTGTMTSGTVPWARLSDHPTIEAGTGLEGGGDLSTNRTLSLTDTGVSAGGYGSTTINYPRFTVDAQGRITSASNQTIRTATTSVSGITTLTASVTTDTNTTAATPWGVKVAYDTATAKASPGTCPSGQVVQNTTTGGVQCVDVDKASAVNGTGTQNTIAKFTGTTTIGDSGINDLSNALAITIDSSERVGIGTTNPSNKLDIVGGLSINGTSVIDSNRIINDFIFDFRYNSGNEVTFWNYNPNYLWNALGKGYTASWSNLTGVTNPDRIWYPDTTDHYTTLNMSLVNDLNITLEGTMPTTTAVNTIRIFFQTHGGASYNNVSFQVKRNDDVWVDVPADPVSYGYLIFSEPLHNYAPYPTYTAWKGIRVILKDKTVSSGNRYLYGIGLYTPRDFFYPYLLYKKGDTMYGSLSFRGVSSDITTYGTEDLALMPGGNVGIGTTSPQQRLHVNGSAVINGTLNMDSNKIISLGNGTSAQDAVTLSQLQSVNESAVAEETDPLWTGNQSSYWDTSTDLDTVISADEISESKIAFSTACAAGNHYYLDGNDLACEADDDTTYTASGTLLDLTGTTFSVNAGTLTNNMGCKFVTGTGIVCDQDYLTSFTETDPKWTGNFSSKTGTGNVVFSSSPTLTTPNIGAATGTSLVVSGTLSGNIDAANLTSGTLNVARLPTSGVSAGLYGNTYQIPAFTVDTYGRVTGVTNTTIRSASTSQTGITQLTASVTSTANDSAATPWSVKTAYDLAASKLSTETDPYWTANQSSYSTTAEILAFGYYNASDFVITDYFTKTDILGFSYYNLTDFDIADYFTSSEVLAFNYYNSSDFDIADYFTSAQILGFNYYNATDFVITDYYTKTEIDSFGFYNLSDFDIEDYYTKTQVYNKTEVDGFSLSKWTDDLGDRGYTHLTNFTDDILWTSGFNATGDSRWLGVGEESDPYWTGNQSSYFNKTDILGFSYYNLTSFDINDYYLKNNPFGFWNDTYATFNETYADTLYYGLSNPYGYYNSTNPQTETDPLWTGNWTNVAFINKANAFGDYNQSFDTNVLFIDATNDRVGIGTTSPNSKLNVAGTFNATSGGSSLIVDANGNVGIGI